jgi:PAS domain S-box-containing protein
MAQETVFIDDKIVSLSDALNSLNEIIYVTDTEGNLVNLYGKECIKTGIKEGTHLHKIVSEIFNSDDSSIHKVSQHRCLQGENVTYDWELNDNYKSYSYQTSLAPLQSSDSNINGVTGIIRNVSREKALDKFHREIEIMFKTLTNAAKSVIISVNEAGAIEYCNPVTEKLFEYEFGELSGRKFSILLYEKDDAFTTDENGNLVMDPKFCQSKNVEMLGLKKNGEKIPIEFSISPYEIINIKHHVIIIQDITERKLAEEQRYSFQKNLEKKNSEIQDALEYTKKMQNQLVQSEKMASLGSLIAGIAHEINNPLAFVSSNLNRFSEYFSDLFNLVDKWKGFGNNIIDEGNYATAIEEIIKHEKEIDYGFIKNDCTELMKHNFEGIERIKKIVQQLRGFTHASDDNAIEADINNAIEETLTIVWNELKYKTDVKKYYGNIPPVQCHISEIKQIFVNLLVNASHAIETRGEITIETLKEDKNVVIKISDTGKGMSAATKRKIFDPFFTTKAVGEGTGLGLWICMSLVQKHHGNIEVKSKEGSGTTFTITLPIEAKQENDQ